MGKQYLKTIGPLLLLLVLVFQFTVLCASAPIPMSQYLRLPDRSKIVRAPSGSWIWCPSIMQVGATYHLFVSIIPYSGTWTNDSKVARYEAADLFGPYTYKGIVLQPTGWITSMIHNPKILQDPVSKKYLLFFIGNNVNYIGYAQADSITGPWTISPAKLSNVSMSNPTGIIQPDGSVYLLGRMKADYNGVASSLIRAYSAPRYNGTYTRLSSTTNNLLTNNCGVEDPCVWYANNQYHLIGNDWVPLLTAGSKNGVQYYSNDGLKYYPVSTTPLFVKTQFKFSNGTSISNTRIERPQVYLNAQNKVTALLVALGDGGTTTLTVEEKGICIVPVNSYDPNGPVSVVSTGKNTSRAKSASTRLILKPSSRAYQKKYGLNTPIYSISGKSAVGNSIAVGAFIAKQP